MSNPDAIPSEWTVFLAEDTKRTRALASRAAAPAPREGEPADASLQPAASVKPTTAAEARDKFLAWIMTKPEAERDAILYAADKMLDLVAGKPHMLNAFALCNAELAALHEEGLLNTAIVVPT